MNEALLVILKEIVGHFWYLTMALIITSFLKKCLYIYIEFQKIKHSNKDIVILQTSESQSMLEIHSTNLRIEDLKRLKDQNVLELKKSS